MTVRWGIIGAGGIAAQLLPDFREADSSEVVAVSSRTAEGAERFATTHEIGRAHPDLEAMLADRDVDAVYIATPHIDHHAIALRALAAGKHVLLEKPAAVSPAQVAEIAAASRQNGRFAMEGMWMKFAPAYRAMRAALEAGAIGEARSVRAYFGLPMPRDGGNRWSAEHEGSTILDQGIYAVTVALDVLGAPVSIENGGFVQEDGVDIRMHATLEFDRGGWAHLAASMLEFAEPSASISGTSGWIHIPFPFWGTTKFQVHTPRPDNPWGGSLEEFPRQGNGYLPMIEAVVGAIEGGEIEHPLHTWEAAGAVHHVMATMRRQLGAGAEARKS